MSRTVDAAGTVVATTLLQVGPCYVIQVKTRERDGYEAAQIGYGEAKRLSRPRLGHLAGIGKLRYLREVPVEPEAAPPVGQEFNVSIFEASERVDVVGVSKGRGFAGVIRRYGFAGGPKSHGQSDRWRAPGAVGAGTDPGRVLKGTRMAGRMGDRRVTVRNLEVLALDPDHHLMAVKGAVPGPRGGLVMVKKTLAAQKAGGHGD